MTIRLLAGDVRDVLPTLAADSVHTVVTSPPYWNLRDYQTGTWSGGDAACDHEARANRADRPRNGLTGGLDTIEAATIYRDTCGKCGARRIDRQIGLEATPDEYLATMVAVFREIRRVLRPDGTCWVNMGDSYAAHPSGHKTGEDGRIRPGIHDPNTTYDDRCFTNKPFSTVGNGYKPKDLLLMPARLALALQADGWWVRSAIVWAKPNPMPESCQDRPTSAYEMVYLLTKRATYFYDADAVRERVGEETRRNTEFRGESTPYKNGRSYDNSSDIVNYAPAGEPSLSGRNLRNVWSIATHAYPNAHFATFPPELAERCIRAGTSEKGCCPQCRAPWYRVTARQAYGDKSGGDRSLQTGFTRNAMGGQKEWDSYIAPATIGWHPTCACDKPGPVVPCTVLDPFAGAGTTLLVANRLQRDAIGIELNVDYTRMAMDRCIADAPLFTSFPPAEDPEESRMADLFAEAAE